MRNMPVASAGRVLTILLLLLFVSHSFAAFSSGNSKLPTVHSRVARRGIAIRAPQSPGGTSPLPGNGEDETLTSGPTSPTVEPDPTPTPTPPPPPPTTTTTQQPPPPTTTTTSTTPTTSTTTTSSTPSQPPRVTTSTSTSSTASTSTTSESTTTSRSTTLSTSTSTSSGATLNLVPLSTTTFTGTPPARTNIFGITDGPTTTVEAPVITNTVTPTSTSRSSSSGFLSNTGAVAATFTVLGLFGIGVGVALWVFFQRRRRKEEQDIFEEEYRDYSTTDNTGYRGQRGSEEHIVPEMGYAAPQLPSINANAMLASQQQPQQQYQHHQQHVPTGSWDMGTPYFGQEANRDSTVSNHAGYGAHGLTPLQRSLSTKNHSSPLAREQYTTEVEYSQPAVAHAQPNMFVPPGRPSQSSVDSFYGATTQQSGNIGSAQ